MLTTTNHQNTKNVEKNTENVGILVRWLLVALLKQSGYVVGSIHDFDFFLFHFVLQKVFATTIVRHVLWYLRGFLE